MTTALNAVENIRNAGIVVDIALEDVVGEEEPAEAVPDPPAAVDNWANPIDGADDE